MRTFISFITGRVWSDGREETLVLFCNDDGRTAFLSMPEDDAENVTLDELKILMLDRQPSFPIGEDIEWEGI